MPEFGTGTYNVDEGEKRNEYIILVGHTDGKRQSGRWRRWKVWTESTSGKIQMTSFGKSR
jgi:hypothetical protein